MASSLLRSGRVLTSDDELARAAAEALDALGHTHAAAAEALGIHRTAVTMALHPEQHRGRGHSVRVGILRLAGYDVEGPSYKLRRRD